MNNELKRIWMKAVMALFYVLSLHLPAETEKNHKNLSHNSWSSGRKLNLGPPKYEAVVLIIQLQYSITGFSQFSQLLLTYNLKNASFPIFTSSVVHLLSIAISCVSPVANISERTVAVDSTIFCVHFKQIT
jgi:hypothetical protein